MLPGGMTPVTQLVAMIRSSPPKGAAGLLMAVPADRLPLLAAQLRPADLARLVPALSAAARRDLVAAVTDERLPGLVAAHAVTLVPAVPTARLGAVVAAMPDTALAALLDALTPPDRQRVTSVTDPRRERGVRAMQYHSQVLTALGRANVRVAEVSPPPAGSWLVTGLRWRIVVAASFGDDGRSAVREAEDTAYRLRADGALAVIDGPAGADVLAYCRTSPRPVDVVTWTDDRHDGHLTRALVRLFQ
jgi:hypothetical protein